MKRLASKAVVNTSMQPRWLKTRYVGWAKRPSCILPHLKAASNAACVRSNYIQPRPSILASKPGYCASVSNAETPWVSVLLRLWVDLYHFSWFAFHSSSLSFPPTALLLLFAVTLRFESRAAKMSRKEHGDKLSIHELRDHDGAELQDYDTVKTKGGTSSDKEDMRRMGRTQELRVRF